MAQNIKKTYSIRIELLSDPNAKDIHIQGTFTLSELLSVIKKSLPKQ